MCVKMIIFGVWTILNENEKQTKDNKYRFHMNHREAKIIKSLKNSQIILQVAIKALLTVYQIVISFDDSFVKSSCISCCLKCETVTLLARSPMMKSGHDFIVLKISVDDATKNDLKNTEWMSKISNDLSYWVTMSANMYCLIGNSLGIDDVFMSSDISHSGAFTYGDISEACGCMKRGLAVSKSWVHVYRAGISHTTWTHLLLAVEASLQCFRHESSPERELLLVNHYCWRTELGRELR